MQICTGCGQNLCERCSKPHGRIPGGGHEVFPLGFQLQSELLIIQGRFCRQHPLNRLDIYCIECNENMRVTCCHTNKHNRHNCQDINEVYQEFQSTIEQDIQLVLDKEKSVHQEVTILKREQEEVIDDILKNETDLSMDAVQIKNHVDEAVNRLLARLHNEKSEVLKAATDRQGQFEFELAAFQCFTRYSSEFVWRGKPRDITHAYKELHTRAGELLQREVRTHDYQLPARVVLSRDVFDEIFDFISTNSSSTLTAQR